jgi:hypothetical protein
MISRVAAVSAAVAMVILVASGCQPEPAPSPSAAAFATEAEAFAAAEETYRAYVDALNQRRSDPLSSQDPQVFLTGPALEVDIDTQQQLDQSGLTLVGSSEIASVNHVSAATDTGAVILEVCLDSTDTRVLDSAGQDVTPMDREAISLIAVDFSLVGGVLLIEESMTRQVGEC